MHSAITSDVCEADWTRSIRPRSHMQNATQLDAAQHKNARRRIRCRAAPCAALRCVAVWTRLYHLITLTELRTGLIVHRTTLYGEWRRAT